MAERMTFQAAADVQAADGKPAKFSGPIYSGNTMRPNGTNGDAIVVLDGIELTDQVPVLYQHDDSELPIGHLHPTRHGNELIGEGVLVPSVNGPVPGILELVKAGLQVQPSIGVTMLETQHVREGETVFVNGREHTAGPGGLLLVTKSILREVSIVTVGADSGAALTITAKQRKDMSDNVLTAQRDRHLEIFDRTAGNTALARRAILEGWDADRAELEARRQAEDATTLEAMRNGRPRAGAPYQIADGGADLQAIWTAAFSAAAGLPNMEKHFDARTLEAAHRSFPGGLRLQEAITLCASRNGYDGRAAVRAGNLGGLLQAAWSTSTISTMLSTVGNKFLNDGFNVVEQVWRAISRPRPVSNFKAVTSYRLTGDAIFAEVAPSGEIKHGTLGQESYSNQARTYARMFTLSRTDILNDDLGAFNDIRNRLGRGAALKLNEVFWAEFLDDASFFTSGYGNLLTGGTSALGGDGVALAAAEKAFLDMSDGDGHPLGIEPALLLLPTALGVAGRKLYAAQEMRDTTDDTPYLTANLFFNRFKPLVSSYIGANNTPNGSDSAWYLLADPANLPVMEVCFLDGVQTPTIESADADFNTLGISTRGFFDFGVAKAEYRAGVKSNGT